MMCSADTFTAACGSASDPAAARGERIVINGLDTSDITDPFLGFSKLANIERGLAQRGWTAPELHRLMGANWLRVYRSVWGA
jgi:microsomal dipeptidase-like Zn-dependent dipeptidase